MGDDASLVGWHCAILGDDAVGGALAERLPRLISMRSSLNWRNVFLEKRGTPYGEARTMVMGIYTRLKMLYNLIAGTRI